MLFYYKAKKLTGEEIKGEKEAKDEFELARILNGEDYILTYYSEKKEGISFAYSFLAEFLNSLNFGGVPVSEKMIFSRNLAVMIEAGISLNRGLETLARQTSNKKFKKVLGFVAEEIKKGAAFHEAISKYPKIFPPIFTALVKSGEKTGKLQESLKILSIQMKHDYELRRRVKGALVYPAIVITAMIAIGILMLVYVVPTLVSAFKELGVELPLSTRIFIGISEFIVNNGFMAFVSFIFILIAVFYLRSFPRTKKVFNFILLHMPILSPLVKKVNTARAARSLSSLVGSGVSILEALQITEEILQNAYYKDALREARGKVEKGEQMSKIFTSHPELFPTVMSEMTAVGEETGKIADMLSRIAGFYESEVSAQTKNLSTIIEPILMLLIGAVVGLFAVSMLQPMYGMMQGI